MKTKSLKEAFTGEDCLMDTEEGLKIQRICWRSLFDSLAAEWHNEGIATKWNRINRLKEFFECDFDGIVYLYARELLDMDKVYRVDGLILAIYQYANYYTDASNYLKLCKHPEFLKFNAGLTQGWRAGVARSVIEEPYFSEETVHLWLTNTKLPG